MQRSFDETKPRPQRVSQASVAVITRAHNGYTEWLLQWNPKWHDMHLIAGHKEATDTNDLTCLVREIHEELFEALSTEELAAMQKALGGENDAYTRKHSAWQDAYIVTISRIGDAPLEYDDVSASAKCLTHYIFHIYDVTLRANVALLQQDVFVKFSGQSSAANEWASAEDIRHGVTAQGRTISSTVQRIINL